MSFATPQLLFDGLVGGLVTGLLAVSVVLVHRSTRVVNFAAAAMGLVGSALLALLTVRYHVPYALALPVALLAGTAFGAAVELSVVRRLFTAPRVIVLVATIGVAQLALVIAASYPSLDGGAAGAAPRYPLPFAGSWSPLPGLTVGAAQLAVVLTVPPVALGLGALLTRTSFGLTVRAAADRPELARLHGISPKLASTLVWAAAGFLAALAMVLVAGQQGSAVELARLGPQTLLRALAAAALARLMSIPVALGAGVAIGVGEALVRFHTLGQPGLADLLLLAIVLAASLRGSGRGARTADRETGAVWTHSYTPRVRPVPPALRRLRWVRHLGKAGPLLLCAAGIALPLAVTQPSRIMLWTTALALAVCAASLTVTTGWAGQLSLGQMAFAGIGALTAATLHRGVRLDLGPLGVHALRGTVLPVAILLAAAATAALSVLLALAAGSGTARSRGLGAAAATFAFAVAAEQYLYRQPFLSGGFGQSVPLPRTTFLGLDVTAPRTYYYVVLTVLVLVLGLLARLRRTAAGRAVIAVRDNPDAAAAWAVPPLRTTLRAFALAGFTAGAGGALLAGAVQSIPWSDRFFLSGDSLLLVSVAVIGGLGSPTGPVLGAAWLTGVPALFPDSEVAPMLTSSLGLLVLLMYFPGGLAQLGHGVRDALLNWAERRHPAEPGPPLRTTGALGDVREHARAPLDASAPAPAGAPLLAVSGIRVRFGGITAVDGVA
ncbi:ABC transporter permease subunit, partial [Streptomyces sp. NPDC054956]